MKRILSVLIAVGIVVSAGATFGENVSGPTLPGTGPASTDSELQRGPTLPGT